MKWFGERDIYSGWGSDRKEACTQDRQSACPKKSVQEAWKKIRGVSSHTQGNPRSLGHPLSPKTSPENGEILAFEPGILF